ncbi:hypothetical protein KUTeg_015657 [Tegillarca granosa]|uniref:glycerophosphocholine cholinephosphodiesterase n=1 Tax=Tegillarca granosa TaxID=220873 RepID=A0ABQ9EWA3_TEGGR|nr:hypothetical protein KUTeg_015657 [Tegillarca granosa]
MAKVSQLMAIGFVLLVSLSYVDAAKGSKLITILLDGFKWNYFDKPGLDLPGFQKIFKNGVRAEYMISDMPTLSFPNYYSIMTGLHCENHGMVGNYMYDKKHNETFLIFENQPVSLHSYWWNDAEPLWITAEKQGKRAYMYHYPGCEVMIKGHNSTFCKRYTGVPTVADFTEDINEAVNQLKSDNADLIKRNLENGVNVMIFSDHGMTEVSQSHVINITGSIDMADVNVLLDRGATVNIWPKEGKVEKF